MGAFLCLLPIHKWLLPANSGQLSVKAWDALCLYRKNEFSRKKDVRPDSWRIPEPKIMRELDCWEGKLTWPLFCVRIAKLLSVASISKHTMHLHPAVKDRLQQRQKNLREARYSPSKDVTLDAATRGIADLAAQVKRLEDTNYLLFYLFRRWQYNAYANNVRMDMFALDKPLPEVILSGKR